MTIHRQLPMSNIHICTPLHGCRIISWICGNLQYYQTTILLTSIQNHLSTFLFSCQQSYKKYDHIIEEHTCTILKILHTQRKVTLQNHSITLVGRDPWWLLVQHLGQSRLLMAMSSSDLSISKEWHLYNLPEQPVLVLYHSRGEKRFPWISSEIPMFQLEAVDSHPNTTHLEKEPGCFFSKHSQ